MPYSGSVYTAPASSWNPAVSGVAISSSDWNTLLADFTGAFNSVPPYAVVQADAFTFGGIAGGTANALTLSLTPALTAYSNGLNIRFTSGAAANTTAATISVNGLAATAVQLAGSALTGGEIQPNRVYQVVYYNTVFHLFQPTAQAPLTLSSTTAATLLTLAYTDAGAGAGPVILLDRNSLTPAASDGLGRIQFTGRDSGAGTDTYAFIDTIIADPTAASEDGVIRLVPTVAGAAAAELQVSNGVQVGSPSGGFKGAGALNAAAGLYVNGHGTVAQVVSVTSATYQTLGTIMPYDNSIPQITEGDEIFNLAVTPTNASSILRFTFTGMVGGGAAGTTVSAGLFVDATANALYATGVAMTNGTTPTLMTFQFEVSAASTSARTYRVRAGNSTATDAFLNGDSGSRNYGGVSLALLKIEEILPQ